MTARRSYTVHGDPAVDALVEADLARVRARLLEELPQLAAIVLVGSFARGEGTVVRAPAAAGGAVPPVRPLRPYNDYDLVLVHPEPVPAGHIRGALGRLARELGFGHLDADVRTPEGLGRPWAPMHDHDLKASGVVLHGDPALLARVPAPPSEKIDLRAAELLVINRLTCLLESVSARSFAPGGLDGAGDAAFAMAYMACKVVLAAAAAMLVWRGAYHASYRERAARFARIYADQPQRCRLVAQATALKLDPPPAEEVPDPVALWFAGRGMYLDVMRESVARAEQLELSDLEALADHLAHRPPKDLLRKMVWKWLDRPKHDDIVAGERRQDVQVAQLDLIRAVRPEGGFDPVLTARAAARLARVRGGGAEPDGWEACRAAAVDADHRFVHPIATGDEGSGGGA